jgi:nitrate reductase molybdenum cofactor assembly chaperone NarJ/NarW
MTYWLVAVFGVLVSLFWLRARHARSKSLQEKYPGGYRQPRVSFFDHESHQILLLDLTYCTPQEVVQGLQEFQEIVSNQPAYSILTIIDLTDGRFTPEAIEQMKRVISESRRYLVRVAFMGLSTLPRKDRSPILKFFVSRYPFFGNKDDALDFVLHDDQYPLCYPVEFKPGTLTAGGSYNWALLYELFSRLLRYPDDEYWTTTERCLAFFAHARTKKLRLLTAFSDEIRNLSTEQLQTLYTETFGLNPSCSLEISSQLRGTVERRELIGWMECQLRELGVSLPTPSLPPDHISTGLLLLGRLHSAMSEDFARGSLSPAIENLIRALKGRNNPFERLLTVVILALDPGGDLYADSSGRLQLDPTWCPPSPRAR